MENRRLLDAGSGTQIAASNWHPTSTNIGDVKNGPMANAGQNLITVYTEYQQFVQNGGQGQFTSSLSKLIDFHGTNVGVDVRGSGDFNAFMNALRNVGMQIAAHDSTIGMAEGFLPIAQLPAVASMVQTVGISPIYNPAYNSVGSASNQSELTLHADQARTQFGVDGTGVMIGALSNSVSRFNGGLADSVASGDLPNNVLIPTDPNTGQPEDGAVGDPDEGRAMLEQIHDIAPGSKLAFATAEGGDLVFAQHIRDLAAAGAKIIVDDVSYFDEPFFQDGPIAQAITDVTKNNGVAYFSSAGNSANSGYLSDFRGVNATVNGVGTGLFMNFNPNGGTTTLMPITVSNPGVMMFEYDQPFNVSNGVKSDLDIFILDANGNVVASGVSNNIATDQPLELFNLGTTGNFFVAVQVKSGPAPGHIEFLDPTGNNFTVSSQFGTAGNTSYGSSFGHHTATDNIGVGAVPWWNAPPWTNPSTVTSEQFSSLGPAEYVFNPDGTPMASVQVHQKPDLSAPDGNDTSFFIPGLLLSTKNPPPGTGPATPTELDGNNLPNFFGTSSAAPNLAAVAALMRQLNPALTSTDIRNAMQTTARPLNGSSSNVWDPQGGFGLVDATKAMQAIDVLRVVSASPGNGQQLASSPSIITVNFSKPVDPTSLNSSELVFTSTPNGVPIPIAGTPTIVPGTNGMTVAFPFSINAPLNVIANGTYAYTIQGALRSLDQKPLGQPFSSSFVVQDTVAPQVTGTTFNNRVIVINFSEAMRGSSVNRNNILLIRSGGTGVFNNPANVILNNDPRLAITYDPINNRAVIDMTRLDQTELPSDRYALVVMDSVTDQVGNKLDGEFTGVFPTGNGTAGGNFVQAQNITLQPPKTSLLRLTEPGDANVPAISDTGISGDQNTSDTQPYLVGQVNSTFPGAIAGLTVVAQFNGLNNGVFDLTVGNGGRGFSGNVNGSYVFATTDANGRFVIRAPGKLPDGFNQVRVVVIGQADAPPLPGLSSQFTQGFRVDTTNPIVLSTSLPNGAIVNNLTTFSINVADPILPSDPNSPLAVSPQLSVPALNPQTADNISNYTLINAGADRILGTADDVNESSFIVGANFVSTTVRALPSDPYTGRVDLSLAPGLPAGLYQLIMRTKGTNPSSPGITDAAGNALDGNPALPGLQDFSIQINLQPQSAFVTELQMRSPNDPNGGSFTSYGPRSYFEITSPLFSQDAPAPPSQFWLDFSNPINPPKPVSQFNPDTGVPFNINAVQLIRSADTPLSQPDGDFGVDGASGFSRVLPPGTSLTLMNSIPGAKFGQPGYLNRLVLQLPQGFVLPADHYRFYMPNTGGTFLPNQPNAGGGTSIFDIFGNQVDGEFLGNPTGPGSTPNSGLTPAPEPPLQYEDLLPTGQYRAGLTGDGVPGGAFETGFTVVPAVTQDPNTGAISRNIIYARPDYVDDPFLTSDDPDGSIQKPFPALAPEAVPNAVNGGDLNSVLNFGTGFDPSLDRNGNGHFDRSALFAAQEASSRGPVVVVALPGLLTAVGQKTFVMQAPAGSDPIKNDGSASLPFDTGLVFSPNSALKLHNAALFSQNQGTFIMSLGGPNIDQQVNFTSFADDSVGGDTNGDGADSQPHGGDWGGIVFRNYDQRNRNTISSVFPIDGRLKGPNGTDARSGEDDALSMLNFSNIRFAGSAVPQTASPNRYDAITSFNSRPLISNDTIKQTGGAGALSSQAAISGDLDSFREDDLTRGMIVRRVSMFDNSINGILVRAQPGGTIEATNAIIRPDNPSTLGGAQNYTFDSNVPYVLLARMDIGKIQIQDTGGVEQPYTDRLYIQPGMMLKSIPGAGIEVTTSGASINIGDRTYINGFDANPNFGPGSPNFSAPTVGDAKVVFTSLFDDLASTFFHDPNTGVDTTVVSPIDSDNGGPFLQPLPNKVDDHARWGGLTISEGGVGVIDEAVFEFGGGPLNLKAGTDPLRPVLTLTAQLSAFSAGAHTYITNNDFFDNKDAAIVAAPNSMKAGDPLRPLLSGHPFFRGNVMQRNTYDALRLSAPVLAAGQNIVAQTVDAVWDATDLTYALRGTIQLDNPFYGFFGRPLPNPNAESPELPPSITLTIQSAVPNTLLANGQHIARPGESVLVKLLNAQPVPGDGANGTTSDSAGGAGFLAGVDDGVDPPADVLIDQGVDSQIRILGVPGNESTGQTRVPAIITSLFDNTVGKTVRGVNMFDVFHPDPTNPNADPNAFINGQVRTSPQPGDGGLIVIGGLSLTDYNLLDPRDGSLIDNADIRYMTRIEMQGGGIVQMYDANNDKSLTAFDDARNQKIGVTPNGTTADPVTQNNEHHAMTISDSNLFGFSQVGVLVHPGFNSIVQDIGFSFGHTPLSNSIIFRAPVAGQPVDLFMVNDTVANMPVGVRINSDTGTGPDGSTDTEQDPYSATFLFNTFNNDDLAIDTHAVPGQTGGSFNPYSSVRFIAMDNIFANSATRAVTMDGQAQGSQLQYNLFFNNAAIFQQTNPGVTIFPEGGFGGNNGIILGDPKFSDATDGVFTLLPGSAAIDAARSEIGPNYQSNAIEPIATQVMSAIGGIRTAGTGSGRLGGDLDFGGLGPVPANQIITAPGSGQRVFSDQWVPVLTTDPTGVAGPASVPGSYNYAPIIGERDQRGFLRIDDPGTPNVGTGQKPFFDVGALEFRKLTAPHVTGVSAVVNDPTSPTGTRPVNIYNVGGVSGTNQVPTQIQFTLDSRLDPNTVNANTVLLEASGGDGIFGNGNSSADRFINLSGKLSFDQVTHVLTINMAGLSLGDDEYRVILEGNGGDVLTDPLGNVLDGENTVANDPNNPQLALPSGNGIPGGNFFLTFTIDTHPPTVVAGSVQLDRSTDSGARDAITNVNHPSFTGLISDSFPPANPGVGETVIVDISTRGDGVFDRLNAGTATTTQALDVNGNPIPGEGRFVVTVTGPPLADSPFKLGRSGVEKLINGDLTGYSIARIRVVDQSGNASNPTAPGNMTAFVLDTAPPRVIGSSPAQNGELLVNGTQATITLSVNKNLDPNTVNPNTIQVLRSGGDGIFGNGNDAAVTVSSVTLSAPNPFTGAETIKIVVSGALPNDLYDVHIAGSGTTVTDIPGNTFAGGFDLNFVVFNSSSSKTLFVGAPASDPNQPLGSRANPYPTIQAGIDAASIGDVVAVLPGVYTEAITLKSLVRVISTDSSSTDTSLVPGNALQTVIRAPVPATPPAGFRSVTVTGTNLLSLANLPTELAGFTIASPLSGDPASGPITPESIGIQLMNSNALIDQDYIVDSNFGIAVSESPTTTTPPSPTPTPTIENDVIVGNIVGIFINDHGTVTSVAQPVQVINNDIGFNTRGVWLFDSGAEPTLASLVNNIFFANNDLSTAQNGFAIQASVAGKTQVEFNMFGPGNGPAAGNPGNETANVGGGFNPKLLSSTTPDSLGNFIGNTAMVSPRDPRPNADGPARFFFDSNFDLTVNSSAIDNALDSEAPPTDLLGRGRTDIANRGFQGHGPSDVGAFEFQGTGGSSVGGSFRVVTTSFSPSGSSLAQGFSVNSSTIGGSITVDFSQSVDKSSVSPTDLILSGTGLNGLSPAHATSLTWVDNHTVKFLLSGGFLTTGTVRLDIPAGAVLSSTEQPLPAFSDFVTLSNSGSSGSGSGGGQVTIASVHSSSTTPSAPTATPTATSSTGTSTSSSSSSLHPALLVAPPPAAPPISTPVGQAVTGHTTHKTGGWRSLFSRRRSHRRGA